MSDIPLNYVDIPRDDMGRITALMIPKEYEEEWVFEILYDFLSKEKQNSEKRRKKKEEEKIFNELHCLVNRPFSSEIKEEYQDQLYDFVSILENMSRDEANKYFDNFTKKVTISLQSGKEVKLFGHTSSKEPEDMTNQELSDNRALLFKNAVYDSLEKFIRKNGICMDIVNHETTIRDKDFIIDFVLAYEEITNKIMIKNRKKELASYEDEDIIMLFKQYRLSQLIKLTKRDIIKLAKTYSIVPLDPSNYVKQFMELADDLIIHEGLSDTMKIIINDDDDEASVLRKDIAHLPQYKFLVNVKDPLKKQFINRRVSYKFDDSMDNDMGGGSSPESDNQGNQDGYDQNGANGQESFSLDTIFDKMGQNDGQFFDQHMNDDVPDEMREQMVRDVKEKLRQRGFQTNEIEQTLNKLKKRKKDYLNEIKRGVSFIKGHIKTKSILKPSRKNIQGVKGKKKYGAKINVILDTSGSMGGYFDKALSFIFRSDIEINLIQCDTEVKAVESIKSMNDVQRIKIKGYLSNGF